MLLAKSLLRSACALALQLSGRLASAERSQPETLTILCYHRVLPQPRRLQYFDPDLVVTPDTLDVHCAALARHYDVVTLEDALAGWLGGHPSGKPRAAITFDDGYRDNETYAIPILAKHGLQATFYVVSGLVGTDEQPWYDRAGRALLRLGRSATDEIDKVKAWDPSQRQVWVEALETEAGSVAPQHDDLIMDEAALCRLVAAGHKIGSHSVTHALLDQLAEPDLDYEVARSGTMLKHVVGGNVAGFCYPNGNFDGAVKAAVTGAGYEYAVSALPGVNRREAVDVFALKRWFISQDRLQYPGGLPSRSLFRMEISGLSQRMFRRGGPS